MVTGTPHAQSTNGPAKHRTSWWLAWASVLVLAAGFAQSLYLTYKVYIPYPDCINGALIYLDLTRDGLQAVSQWTLNADNFIFNLHWISWAWFALFGSSVLSLTVFSNGIFLLCVAAAAAIVFQVTANRILAVTAFALFFPTANNLINTGQSHPVAHGITMVYVLAAVIVSLDILESSKRVVWRWSVLVLATAACTLSDPWFDVAFAAPALLTLAIMTFAPGRRLDWSPMRAGVIATGTLLGVVIGRGAYELLVHYQFITDQPTPLASFSVARSNLQLLPSVLPIVFNYDTTQAPAGTEWIFIVAGIALLGVLVSLAPTAWQRATTTGRFLLLFGLLSGVLMAGAFVATGYATSSGPSSARYLLNVYYLVFVMGIVIVGEAWTRLGWRKLVVIVWLTLFCVPGTLQVWRTFRQIGLQHASVDAHREVITLLEKEGLHEGFAPYFSGQVGANSLTYMSGYRVAVRPVDIAGGRLRPFGVNVNRSWFGEGKSANFVAVHASGESTFEAAALASFGPPERTIRQGEYVVWVWPGNLMGDLLRP